MTRKFSKSYKTYSDWLSKAKKTTYTKRISRLHTRYPKATLSQLRGHPRGRERALRLVMPKPIFKRKLMELSPRESYIRSISFDVLSEVRRGKGSLSHIARLHHTTPQTVLRHTHAFKKVGNRWIPKRYDKIERLTRTFEKGNRRLDVVSFVVLLERDGIARRNISDFLKDSGIDDITIINIFGKVDLKKSGSVGREISQVVLED